MVYLIDASVYIFRAYYSMPPDMQDRDGRPAHALFGFARFLGDLIERARPEYIAVAFDESLQGSFRNRIYPPYKANREPAPEDLKQQFGRCREFCRHLGIAEFADGEYEADDIIGTLHARLRAEGVPATVVTRDKDLAQLICLGDVYWSYTDNLRLQHHEIAGHFGVPPERYADYLALTGMPSTTSAACRESDPRPPRCCCATSCPWKSSTTTSNRWRSCRSAAPARWRASSKSTAMRRSSPGS